MENNNKKRVLCRENEALASFMLQKKQELAETPKGLSENRDITLSKAYDNVCCSNSAIKSLKDLSRIKGVGKWILKLMQGFFVGDSGGSKPEDSARKGKRDKGKKRYVPQKNSVAYALLITLYRGIGNGNEFMRKQELIDAAEASGLSRVPIAPEKEKGKPDKFRSSPRNWYSGWSCMKTLITKGLVVRSSCPAKYMLTEEGQEAARECLMRSRLVDPQESSANIDGSSDLELHNESDLEFPHGHLAREATSTSVGLSRQQKPFDVPLESLEKFMRMGFSREQIVHAFVEVSETSQNKEISSLWPAVLCRLREDQVYGLHSEPQALRMACTTTSTADTAKNGQLANSRSAQLDLTCDAAKPLSSCSTSLASASFTLRGCSSSHQPVRKSSLDAVEAHINYLSMPPLKFGERFEDAYEIILILDDREHFAIQGSRGMKLIENICKEHKILVEVRRLPVGDGIWIARHKYLCSEYVLDFIVERKKVDDLRSSIRDNRYRDQKLRLLRCGLKKLIYLVEGDPNSSEAAESIKTACFTTEILEGFDVQRTSGLHNTLKKYGYLTRSITQYYRSQLPQSQSESAGICPSFDEFVIRCEDLDKITVSDVFAIQLMQVPQVTEEVALAVLDLYPTLLSLAQAYSLLDGDVRAQQEMLRNQSKNIVTAAASRNIFQFVWGSDN